MLPLSTPRDDFVLLVPPLLLILGGPRCTFISVPYSILILLLSPPNGILYRVLTPSTNFAPDFKRGGGGAGRNCRGAKVDAPPGSVQLRDPRGHALLFRRQSSLSKRPKRAVKADVLGGGGGGGGGGSAALAGGSARAMRSLGPADPRVLPSITAEASELEAVCKGGYGLIDLHRALSASPDGVNPTTKLQEAITTFSRPPRIGKVNSSGDDGEQSRTSGHPKDGDPSVPHQRSESTDEDGPHCIQNRQHPGSIAHVEKSTTSRIDAPSLRLTVTSMSFRTATRQTASQCSATARMKAPVLKSEQQGVSTGLRKMM